MPVPPPLAAFAEPRLSSQLLKFRENVSTRLVRNSGLGGGSGRRRGDEGGLARLSHSGNAVKANEASASRVRAFCPPEPRYCQRFVRRREMIGRERAEGTYYPSKTATAFPTSLTLHEQFCVKRSVAHATKYQLITVPRGSPGEAWMERERPIHTVLENAAAVKA